jgi:hypothetical protein
LYSPIPLPYEMGFPYSRLIGTFCTKSSS